MRIELQQELFRRYPRLFRKPGMRLVDRAIIGKSFGIWEDETGSIDQWGIECGDEWLFIVNQLSEACEAEIDKLVAEGLPMYSWPRIAQIKEKFGTLRFYVRGRLSKELREEISHACDRPRPVDQKDSSSGSCDPFCRG